MSYSAVVKQNGREPFVIVEEDLDYCANTFGSAPCTAIGSGDDKCHNTYANCQDRANYVKSTKTYKFCTKTANYPRNLGLIPCIDPGGVTTVPSKIIPGKSLGTRTSVTVSMTDFPHHDRGFDPYYADRTYSAEERGTFHGKYRARNKYYQSRDVRVKYGFLDNGVYDEANFKTHYYVFESMTGPDNGDKVTHVFNDVLKKTSYDRAQCPRVSKGSLSAAITAGATAATLTPSGIGDIDYPASGYIALDDEVVSFTRSGDTLTIARAQFGTVAASHDSGVPAQLCYDVSSVNVIDIIKDLLENYAGIDASMIPYSTWELERDDYLSIYNLTSIVPEPVGVSKLLNELILECGLMLAWDDINQHIMLKAVRSGSATSGITDSKIIRESVTSTDKPNERISQIWYHYGWRDPFNRKELKDFGTLDIFSDADSESENKYNETRQEKIYSRWVTASGIVAEVASRRLKRYKDNPKYVKMKNDIKDAVTIGDFVGIESTRIQDASGFAKLEGYQVISTKSVDTYSKQELELLFMPFNRYAKIAPNSMPDYTSATQNQKDVYGFICDSTTLQMSNGDDGYVIQ